MLLVDLGRLFPSGTGLQVVQNFRRHIDTGVGLAVLDLPQVRLADVEVIGHCLLGEMALLPQREDVKPEQGAGLPGPIRGKPCRTLQRELQPLKLTGEPGHI